MAVALDLLQLGRERVDPLLIVLGVKTLQVFLDDGQLGFDVRRFAEILVGHFQKRFALLATFHPAGPLDKLFAVGGSALCQQGRHARAQAAQSPLCVDGLAPMVLELAPGATVLVADDAQRFELGVPGCQDIERRFALEFRRARATAGIGHPREERFDRAFELAPLVAGGLPGPQVVAGLRGAVPRVERFVDLDRLGMPEIFQEQRTSSAAPRSNRAARPEIATAARRAGDAAIGLSGGRGSSVRARPSEPLPAAVAVRRPRGREQALAVPRLRSPGLPLEPRRAEEPH